jgi:hypothetical protein
MTSNSASAKHHEIVLAVQRPQLEDGRIGGRMPAHLWREPLVTAVPNGS